ncbi:MAG TPA: VOC family protein [Acidimicrobiales bacterium]|nr:VOC family protein [Acidimicrobiales bacterium]
MAAAKPRLSHIGLPVTDLAKSIAFYEKWAGMKVQKRPNDPGGVKGARLSYPDGDFAISLLEMPVSNALPMPGVMHLGLDCTSKAQVDKIASDAKKAGILLSGPIDSGADLGYQTYISDPDGNNLEFSFGQKLGISED